MARARLSAFVSLNTTSFRRGLRAMRRRWRAFKMNVVAPMMRFGQRVGRAFLRGGILIGAALAGGIRHANQFRQQMAEVNTMLDGQRGLIEDYTDQLIRMSGRFGQAKGVMAKGLYDILSAGIAASEGLDFLAVAAKAAIGGATDTAIAVDALTTIVNAFGIAAKDVGAVSNVMFQIVKDGKITYEELAENIGKIAPTARAAGLSLEKMGAVIATLVKVEKPERAMTALRAALMLLAKTGDDLFDTVKKFKGKSLADVVQAGISRRAAVGIVLLANNFDILTDELERFQNVGGRAESAFQKMDRVRFWQKIWRTILGTVTRIAMVIDKTLAPAINFMRRKLDEMVDSPGFQRFLEKVQEAAITVVGVLTAIGRGGGGRTMALRGLKLLIIGAFQSGAFRAVAILLKAAWGIGLLIADGIVFKLFQGSREVAERMEAKKAAKTRLGISELDLLKSPEIRQAFFKLRDEILDEIRAQNLINQAEKLARMLGTVTDGSLNVEKGLDLLKAAARLATIDLEEFGKQTKPIEGGLPSEPIPTGVGTGGEGEGITKERQFSELRRIGANIIGRGVGGDPAQNARMQLIEQNKMINTWLKKNEHHLAMIEQAEEKQAQEFADLDLGSAKF